MTMGRLFIKNQNQTIDFTGSDTILQVLQREGIALNAPCGGHGTCGKCLVRLETDDDDRDVLACQTTAEDGMILDISASMLKADGAVILTDSFSAETAGPNRPIPDHQTSDYRTQDHCKQDHPEQDRQKPNRLLTSLCVPVPPCPPGESISDWTRLRDGLQRTFPEIIRGKELQIPAPDVLSAIGPELKKARGTLAGAGEDGVLHTLLCAGQVLKVSAEPFPVCLAAFDVGTTTVAGYLLDGPTGNTIATASCMNPQAQYGADVIARANYTLENGMAPVSRCIRAALNSLLQEMTASAGKTVQDVYLISIAGNTCMHHLFLGISVDSLVHAPYNPAVSDAMLLRASAFDLDAGQGAMLAMIPCIAGFVGADTVACMVSTRLAEQQEWTLLVDIGTNGEMVLAKDHRMAACSTAAGPAFEGAGISCGMRGAAGAISKAAWKEDHWEFDVIGSGKVRGICGSGLLDITAQLLESGQMDETGDMESDDILLASPEESVTGSEIRLLKKDIRQLQLAKAAIATGVRLLARKLGVEMDEIRQVWLAGAFGSFLSPESACTIGMIPQELRGRIRAVGNAAGEGAKNVLQSPEAWEYASQLSSETEFLELASMPEFNDTFIDEIMFPEI